MEWFWGLIAFALATGAFYSAYEAEKKEKKLENRIRNLEEKIK